MLAVEGGAADCSGSTSGPLFILSSFVMISLYPISINIYLFLYYLDLKKPHLSRSHICFLSFLIQIIKASAASYKKNLAFKIFYSDNTKKKDKYQNGILMALFTKMGWNEQCQWVVLERVAAPPIFFPTNSRPSLGNNWIKKKTYFNGGG